jgi:hypothetical protein
MVFKINPLGSASTTSRSRSSVQQPREFHPITLLLSLPSQYDGLCQSAPNSTVVIDRVLST